MASFGGHFLLCSFQDLNALKKNFQIYTLRYHTDGLMDGVLTPKIFRPARKRFKCTSVSSTVPFEPSMVSKTPLA